MSGRAVTDWLAVVPLDLCPAGFAREELVRRMVERYPGMRFVLEATSPFGDDVQVFPIRSQAGPNGSMAMLDAPSAETIDQITDALWDVASGVAFALN